MTLIPELNLDMVKMFNHTKSEVFHSKVIAWTGKHTDTTKTLLYPYTQEVKKRSSRHALSYVFLVICKFLGPQLQ